MSTFEDVTDSGDSGGDGGITRKLVEEMVPFLRDPRPEIRQAAAATAVAASASKAGVALLHQCGAVKWLCRISGDVGMMEAVSDEACLPAMRDLCLQLLANVSRVQLGAEKVAQVGVAGGAREGQYIRKLARWLALHPAQEGLPYPALVGTSREDRTGREGRRGDREVGGSGGGGGGVVGRGEVEGLGVGTGVRRDQPRHCKDRGMGGLRRTGWLRALEEWGGGGGAEGFGGGARVVDRRAALRDSQGSDDEDGGGGGGGGGGEGDRATSGGAAPVVLDQWQHCASVLCNAARTPEGRKALRRPDPRVALSELLPQLSSANPVRRWGIAGCVRNCCFEELDHAWLLHEVKVVPHLLMRLADDSDVYDFDEKVLLDPRVWRKEEGGAARRREPVQCIKRDIVEALLQAVYLVSS
eukprot:jgi/Undpi1/271/HiC_scaffold_1.g00267.m1